MNRLEFCFACTEKEKLYPPIPPAVRKIQQAGKNIAPHIHRAVNHKWDLK